MKAYFFVSLIIFLLLLSGCANSNDSKYRGDDPDAWLCEKMDSVLSSDSCYRHLGSAKQNLNLCDKIQNRGDSRELCYADVAEKSGDISICEGLFAGYGKDTCYKKVATKLKDLSICEKIQDIEYFLDLYDPYSFSATSIKETCYASIATELGDVSICEKIGSPYVKDFCYQGVAMATNDETLCKKMSGTEYIEIAMIFTGDCYKAIAIAKQNLELCKIDGIINSDCYAKIAAAKKDSQLCEEADESIKSHCFHEVAIATENMELCQKLSHEKRKSCMWTTAAQNKDLSVCNQTNEYFCYRTYARISGDVSACEKIQSEQQKIYCYNDVAGVTKDVSICEKMDGDMCYHTIVQAMNDQFFKSW